MWEIIWNIANSNLVILLLGSGLGFLFVRLVWEPYKQRQEENSRRGIMKEEAFFRLASFENQIVSGNRVFVGQLDGLGDFAPSLTPDTKNWSFDGLVYVGWGKDIYKECNPHIARLKQAEESGTGEEHDIELAEDAINNLRKLMQT